MLKIQFLKKGSENSFFEKTSRNFKKLKFSIFFIFLKFSCQMNQIIFSSSIPTILPIKPFLTSLREVLATRNLYEDNILSSIPESDCFTTVRNDDTRNFLNCLLLTAKETRKKSALRHSRKLLAGISTVFTDEMPDY